MAAPSEHDDAEIRKASGAIHRREFVLRDPCRTESAMTVHAAMVVGGITPTRGGTGRVRAARAFPSCVVGAASRELALWMLKPLRAISGSSGVSGLLIAASR